jgi:hypothetical protein
MGKKNRKKQDDGDYFASLGAPTENAVDDAAAEKAEEERLARQAKAAAQREAKKQKEAQERAERAAVAERARLAMERRNNKGRAVVEDEAEEAVEEPAPAPVQEAEEAAPPPPPLSAFARVLLFLRPFSPVHKSILSRRVSIMASTPSTRRQLDGVALWYITARFSQHGRVFAENGLRYYSTRLNWLTYAQVLARRRRCSRRRQALAPALDFTGDLRCAPGH